MFHISKKTAVLAGLLIMGLGAATASPWPATGPLVAKGEGSAYWGWAPTPDPAVVALADSGVGEASHIGVFRLAASELDNVVAETISGGAFTLTTPAGDSIF